MELTLASGSGNEFHVTCTGTVSQSEMKPGQDPLGEVIGPDGYTGNVYLDLSRARYIDSSGIAWLLARNKAFKAAGGKLTISSPSPLVRQALELLKLHKVLTIVNDVPAHKAATGSVD